VVFEKLVQVLVFGCAYWRIADEECSATTLRRRRDEWIEAGVMDTLEEMARESYDRVIGLKVRPTWLSTVASTTRRLVVGRRLAGARWTGESGASNARW